MSVAGATDLLAGRYRLDQQVASGGLSEVWRATDTVLQRPVAVKLLRARISADPQGAARLHGQAQHAGALADQNIARVYDYYEPGPGYPAFLVMEFVDGTSLAEVLAGGPLPPARVMDLVAQCAAGLAAAHQSGLVHRDITPANILISNDGLVKLTGFGISDAAGTVPVAGTGTLLGTSAYLAPEQARGDQDTAAGDLYSLGVVAYHCLAGRLPFGRPAAGAAGARLLLSPLPASVPAEAAALVGRLTAHDPQARPVSAGQVAREAADLRDRLTSGNTRDGRVPPALGPAAEPATAGPARPWDSTRPWEMPRPALPRRRRRRPLFAAAAILSVLAAVLAVSLASQATQIDAAAAPPMSDLVQVDGQSLHGRPVGAVHRLLHHLGLAVRVQWRSSDRLPPGRVLSVRPNGLVHTGTMVVVTAARASAASAPGTGGTAGQRAPGRGKDRPRRAAHQAPQLRPTADPSPTGSPGPTGSPSPGGSPPPTSPAPTPSGGPTTGPPAP